MLNALKTSSPPTPPQTEVLFLSSPLGHPREWMGLSEALGAQAACCSFRCPAALRKTAHQSACGAHLVAHGSAAYHVLKLASQHPHLIHSVTLVDPDILPALPDLRDCPSYRHNRRLTATAMMLVEQGQTTDAARIVVDWWMGRSAWANTSERLQERFCAAMPGLVAEWRAQAAEPLCLLGLASLECPLQIVAGQKAPADIRSLAQIMRLALPRTTLMKAQAAQGASHLTHPHLVGPAFRNFVVCNHRRWQTEPQRKAA